MAIVVCRTTCIAMLFVALKFGMMCGVATGQVSNKWVGNKPANDNLVYVREKPGAWKEFHRNGAAFSTEWKETTRDSTSVTLHDASRNYWLRLTATNALLKTEANGQYWELIQGEFSPAPSIAKGLDVRAVVYSNTDHTITGRFLETAPGKWIETVPNGEHTFTEHGRDEWSVYLKRDDNGTAMQIDLYRNQVFVNQHQPLYEIVSSDNGEARNVFAASVIRYSRTEGGKEAGRFVATGRENNWIEQSPDHRFNFTLVKRDNNSITLKKFDGAVITLDFVNRRVILNGRQHLYHFIESGDGKGEETINATYVVSVQTGSRGGTFNVEAAGTDSNIKFRLVGNKGTSEWVNFPGSHGFFEANTFDAIQVELADVGTLTSIEISKDNAGSGPDWYPTSFGVQVKGQTYQATNSDWINSNSVTLPLSNQ